LKGEKYNVALMMTSTYAIGPDYIGGEIISALHVNNVFEDLGRYAQVTKESIAKVNPDILMYQSLGMGDNITDHAAYIASLAEDPVLGKISAVENGLVYSTKDAAKNVVSTIKQSIVCAYAIFAMFIYNEYLDFELPHVLDNDNYVEYLKKFWNQVNS
jgi:ABC-type Fe3+-hydroxamate transport system substrate-binding protein